MSDPSLLRQEQAYGGGVHYAPVSFKDLPGWEGDAFGDALQAFHHSATFFGQNAHSWATTRQLSQEALHAWQEASKALMEAGSNGPQALKNALTRHLAPYQLITPDQDKEGILTGYYHPVLSARRTKDARFDTPILRRPHDLILVEDAGGFNPAWEGTRIGGRVEGGTLVPYFTRKEIMAGALDGRNLEIAWVEDQAEAFFMMVQGSGTLLFEDERTLTLDYAATNGHPYASIGRVLLDQGALDPERATARDVKDWLCAHPHDAPALMAHNPSYVFFKEADKSFAPCGALGTPLTPLRSLACDPRYIPLGAPVWVSAARLPWQSAPFSRLFFAQDVGGAIKGHIRADLYCGVGEEGFDQASDLNHKGALFILWPRVLGAPHVR
ncbi:MAG: murein transglycosylase [Candidatus Puniceispirillum sp.]|nr:murein transglycosylase [Candidatus Puniceispirillum sp.]